MQSRLSFCALLLAVVACLGQSAAQQVPGDFQTQYSVDAEAVKEAIRLTNAFYPELASIEGSLSRTYQVEGPNPVGQARVCVYKPFTCNRPGEPECPKSPCINPVIDVTFSLFKPPFRGNGVFFASGPFGIAARSKDPVFDFLGEWRRDRLERLVREHPDWSEEDVIGALAVAGAKYTPNKRDLLLRRLEGQLASAIGQPVEIRELTFKLFQANGGDPRGLIWLTWFATIRVTNPKCEIFATVDPFEGRVLSMTTSLR